MESGPGCKVLPRKRVGKKAVAGGGVVVVGRVEEAKVGSTWKFGGEKEKGGDPAGRSNRDPESQSLRRGLSPWRPPGSPPPRHDPRQGRRGSLTSGLKLLWAELREASAVVSTSRQSSRLREGGGAGNMVRDRPSRPAVRTLWPGPSPGVTPPLPRTPLSSGGAEFGFLERCLPGDEAIVLESAC